MWLTSTLPPGPAPSPPGPTPSPPGPTPSPPAPSPTSPPHTAQAAQCPACVNVPASMAHSRVHNISVLEQEEGYTVKYGLRPREIPRAQAIFYRISRLES